jgi:hypothetical protein
MKKAILILLTFFVLPTECLGFYKTLNDSLVQEAINYASSAKQKNILEFKAAWTFIRDLQKCTVETKFLLVAESARRSMQRYQKISPTTVSYINSSKYLEFRLDFLGGYPEFASDLHSVIKIDSLTIQPVKKKNENYASTSVFWPGPSGYEAICYHSYLLKDIPKDAKIQLIAINVLGEETIFNIDLSKIK